MQVSALTDDELRSLIDVEPGNLDAVREGARRFVEGSTCEAIRIEELESALKRKEEDLRVSEIHLDASRASVTNLQEQLKRAKATIQNARRELADA